MNFIKDLEIMEQGSVLYLVEPTKRHTEYEPADKLLRLVEENQFTIIEKEINKFSLIVARKC